ncbi:hypothetical protein WDZ92_39445 [Nostoc sp. NIES-2111]
MNADKETYALFLQGDTKETGGSLTGLLRGLGLPLIESWPDVLAWAGGLLIWTHGSPLDKLLQARIKERVQASQSCCPLIIVLPHSADSSTSLPG